ncbi:MAG: sodium:calcium antiporter [Chloroflexi bacterium]|nr:MAG: sodium:calcium antiporter [Chloroflexota bacterium]
MAWIIFFITAGIITYAATKLAEYGDVISVRANLSGAIIGTILMAGATSLPELLSAVNAISIGVPDLAGGSMFGSGMFNMLMLGLLDLLFHQKRVLRRVASSHALTGGLAILVTALAAFFLLADIDLMLGWVGLDSLLIIALYFGGVRILQQRSGPSLQPDPAALSEMNGIPSLKKALLGFGAATFVLIIVTPYMVDSANTIAELTGISSGFIGASLIAITTSLPELIATVAAVRIGAFDLAVGNLFGSNLFNMFALGLTDIFYGPGRFLGAIDPVFAIVALLVVIMISLGLIGNLARIERRLWIIEVDALVLILTYIGGMYLIYARGIGT